MSHKPNALAALVAFFGLIFIVASVATFALYERQQHALDAARQAEFRICQRQMINRAALDSDLADDKHPPLVARLPIYDCTHNLRGHPALRLNATQTRAFLRHVATTRDPLP